MSKLKQISPSVYLVRVSCTEAYLECQGQDEGHIFVFPTTFSISILYHTNGATFGVKIFSKANHEHCPMTFTFQISIRKNSD